MTAHRAHLQLMSKPRLIAIIERMRADIDASQSEAKHWRAVATGAAAAIARAATTPEAVAAEAAVILASLPVDPDAEQHRDDLLAAIPKGGNERRAGSRCARDYCDRLVRPSGAACSSGHPQPRALRVA